MYVWVSLFVSLCVVCMCVYGSTVCEFCSYLLQCSLFTIVPLANLKHFVRSLICFNGLAGCVALFCYFSFLEKSWEFWFKSWTSINHLLRSTCHQFRWVPELDIVCPLDHSFLEDTGHYQLGSLRLTVALLETTIERKSERRDRYLVKRLRVPDPKLDLSKRNAQRENLGGNALGLFS